MIFSLILLEVWKISVNGRVDWQSSLFPGNLEVNEKRSLLYSHSLKKYMLTLNGYWQIWRNEHEHWVFKSTLTLFRWPYLFNSRNKMPLLSIPTHVSFSSQLVFHSSNCKLVARLYTQLPHCTEKPVSDTMNQNVSCAWIQLEKQRQMSTSQACLESMFFQMAVPSLLTNQLLMVYKHWQRITLSRELCSS